MDDQRAGNKIAHATMLLIQQHGDNADSIKSRQVINDPEEIAGRGFKRRDRTARILDDANPRPFLSRRLTFPDRFEYRVVTPINGKPGEDYKSYSPFSGQPGQGS